MRASTKDKVAEHGEVCRGGEDDDADGGVLVSKPVVPLGLCLCQPMETQSFLLVVPLLGKPIALLGNQCRT